MLLLSDDNDTPETMKQETLCIEQIIYWWITANCVENEYYLGSLQLLEI